LMPLQKLPANLVMGSNGETGRVFLERLATHEDFAQALFVLPSGTPTPTGAFLSRPMPPKNRFRLTPSCPCCAGNGGFATVLEDILRDRDNHRLAPFSRIVAVTGPTDDPIGFLHAVMTHPYLGKRFYWDGLVSLGDGTSLTDRRARALADTVIGDGAEQTPRLTNRAVGPDSTAEQIRHWLAPENVFRDTDIRRDVLLSDKALTPRQLSVFMETLTAAHGRQLLRLKGRIRHPDGTCSLIHAIRHVAEPPLLSKILSGAEQSCLTVSSDGLEPDRLARIYHACASL
jgi:G3E family GTPase